MRYLERERREGKGVGERGTGRGGVESARQLLPKEGYACAHGVRVRACACVRARAFAGCGVRARVSNRSTIAND